MAKQRITTLPTLFFLVIFHSFNIFGTTQPKVIGIKIDGLHQTDGLGAYDLILKKDKKAELIVLPPKRAFAEFQKSSCVHCCLSPANLNPAFYDFQEKSHITSDSMNVAAIYIWSPPNKRPITRLEDLKGKRVGARLGMPYGKSVEKMVRERTLKLDLVVDIENSIQKIYFGRLDYMIAYTPDACKAFKNLNRPSLPYVIDRPILKHLDQVLCKRTDVTEAYIKRLNQKFIDQSHKSTGCE